MQGFAMLRSEDLIRFLSSLSQSQLIGHKEHEEENSDHE
jgi:hypothetical protein